MYSGTSIEVTFSESYSCCFNNIYFIVFASKESLESNAHSTSFRTFKYRHGSVCERKPANGIRRSYIAISMPLPSDARSRNDHWQPRVLIRAAAAVVTGQNGTIRMGGFIAWTCLSFPPGLGVPSQGSTYSTPRLFYARSAVRSII